ncbi:unnamed protein product [Tilletia controversa]|nr:unnamed protein product [Tilletia controversa]
MMIDDEEKNRRMRKAGRKKPYSIRAAVASSASARPTSQNGARTQVQNALSQHRQRHTLPPSPISVPASIEEEDLSSEECDYFFIPLPTTTAAPATVEHQKADDEQRRRHILPSASDPDCSKTKAHTHLSRSQPCSPCRTNPSI